MSCVDCTKKITTSSISLLANKFFARSAVVQWRIENILCQFCSAFKRKIVDTTCWIFAVSMSLYLIIVKVYMKIHMKIVIVLSELLKWFCKFCYSFLLTCFFVEIFVCLRRVQVSTPDILHNEFNVESLISLLLVTYIVRKTVC